MAEPGTLRDAFIDELRDTYDAERQLTKALPKLAKASSSSELRDAFESHLDETQGSDRATRIRFRTPRREGAWKALRRHRGDHRRRQVGHGGGLRRGHHGRMPDRFGATRRALRDGGLRHPGGVGSGDWRATKRPLCCSRTLMKRGRPTKSFRRWRKAASISGQRTPRTLTRSRPGLRLSPGRYSAAVPKRTTAG